MGKVMDVQERAVWLSAGEEDMTEPVGHLEVGLRHEALNLETRS